MSKVIAIIGTLDTKGDQISYMADIIKGKGHRTVIIDTGVLGEPQCDAAVTRHQIAEAAGTTIDEIMAIGEKGQETRSMGKMAEGARVILKKLNDEQSIDGVLAVGGSMGTALALKIMDVVPLMMPKIILSTIANSPIIDPDNYTNNILMMPWIGGLWGINEVSRKILDQAAGLTVTASELFERKPLSSKKLIGVASLGMAAALYLNHLRPGLEERNFEVSVFHATGMSPRLLEKAIAEGSIDIALELFIGHEFCEEVLGSSFSPGPNRLEAAITKGIPMIASPGTMELVCVGANKPLPGNFPERVQLEHNTLLWMVTTSVDEKVEAAEMIVEKLNRTTGPTAFIFTLRNPDGITKYGLDDSEGMEAVRQVLKSGLKPEVEYIEVDCSQDDPLYAEMVIKVLDEIAG